jgi:hypothetical protein
VVTLEDTKIRHRKIEERETLRDIEAADWHERLETVGMMGTPPRAK